MASPGACYTPFRAAVVLNREGRTLPSSGAAPWGQESPESSWDQWLDEVCRQLGSASAWVVDGHGFLVCRRGPLSDRSAETAGARVLETFDHARGLGAAPGHDGAVVTIDMGERWLTGIEVEANGARYALLVSTSDPLSRQTCRATAEMLAARLQRRTTSPR